MRLCLCQRQLSGPRGVFGLLSSFVEVGVQPRLAVRRNIPAATSQAAVDRAQRIPAEAEINCAVVAQDGTVDRHLTSYRDTLIAMQHLVPEQIKRDLRPRHIRADEVEWRDGQPARKRTSHAL